MSGQVSEALTQLRKIGQEKAIQSNDSSANNRKRL